MMMFGYFLFGCGSTLSTYLILAYIENNVEEERAPKYIGTALAGMVFSSAIGGFVGAQIGEVTGRSELEKTHWPSLA